MKREIITTLLVMTGFWAMAQEIGFEVRGAYVHPVNAEKVHQATNMSDLIDGYPESWITEYVSTGISLVSGDKVHQAMSADANLTSDQVSLLKTADLGDDVVIDVTYKSKNFITKQLDVRNIHYAATIVPEHEAEYTGGREHMIAYLQESAMDKIPDGTFKELQRAIIRFTIDEQGKITNPRVTTTSGDPKIDNIMLKALKDMPTWKPAKNSKGIKVAQDFEFIVGNTGC